MSSGSGVLCVSAEADGDVIVVVRSANETRVQHSFFRLPSSNNEWTRQPEDIRENDPVFGLSSMFSRGPYRSRSERRLSHSTNTSHPKCYAAGDPERRRDTQQDSDVEPGKRAGLDDDGRSIVFHH